MLTKFQLALVQAALDGLFWFALAFAGDSWELAFFGFVYVVTLLWIRAT